MDSDKNIYGRKYYAENKERHLLYVQTPIKCNICDCFHARCKTQLHKRTNKHIKNEQLLNLSIENEKLKQIILVSN